MLSLGNRATIYVALVFIFKKDLWQCVQMHINLECDFHIFQWNRQQWTNNKFNAMPPQWLCARTEREEERGGEREREWEKCKEFQLNNNKSKVIKQQVENPMGKLCVAYKTVIKFNFYANFIGNLYCFPFFPLYSVLHKHYYYMYY